MSGMPSEMQADDNDSTLVRRGRDAVTFTEMAAFVRTLEDRPIPTLLGELPEIARLSEPKFTLAMKILRKRFENEHVSDQQQLRVCADEVASRVPELPIALRIRRIFAMMA
jgi:hypothetical protein